MKKFILFTLLTLISFSGFSWGRLGHDVSARIAEKYLTPKAKKNIAKYIDGKTIGFYSSYMDYMGYVNKLGYSNMWHDHTVPVDKDFNYSPESFEPVGDAEYAVEVAVEKMKDGAYKNLPDSLVNLYIKHLVHFLPDSHCPSHLIYNFRSTNYLVKVGKKEVLFHGIWDAFPDTYGMHAWGVTDYCEYLTYGLTKEQKQAIEKGTTRDWVHQSAADCIKAYDIVREGDSLTDTDCCNGTALADEQLLKGGIRLAYILNMIFGK